MGSLTFLEQFERFIEGPLEELWLSFTEQAATSSERSGHFPVELGLATAHGPMRFSPAGGAPARAIAGRHPVSLLRRGLSSFRLQVPC